MRNQLFCLGLFLGLSVTATFAQSEWTSEEIQKLVASDGSSGDALGFSMAMDGDVVVAGAPNAGPSVSYVFEKQNGVWKQTAKLRTSDNGNKAGWSVAIDGDIIVVGAAFDDGNGFDAGALYVYEKPVGGWKNMTETQKVVPNDIAPKDRIGYDVGVSGNTIISGSYGDDDDGNLSGALYVFEKINNSWQQIAKLKASDGRGGAGLGRSLYIDGDVIVGAARNRDDNGKKDSGAAYVYVKPANGWKNGNETGKLLASDPGEGDLFGYTVIVEGDVIVCTTREDNDNGVGSGSAYIFEKPANGWRNMTETQKILANDGMAGDQFGYSSDISNGRILIGSFANSEGANQGGAAYIFEKLGNTWTQVAKLLSSDITANDEFGSKVAMSENVAVVGARAEDAKGNGSGSVYFFDRVDVAFEISGLNNITQSNDQGQCGASITLPTPTLNGANGNVSITTSLGSQPGTSYNFPIGQTTVTYEATDDNETISTSFTVTINDTEKPTIACPSNINVEVGPGINSSVVTFANPTFNDNCPNPSLNQTNGLASGANFPVGTTTNTFVVTDAAGNTETCSFTVTITTQKELQITGLSDIVQSNDQGQCGATFNIPSPTIENGVGQLTIETSIGNPGASFNFPVGLTEIVYTVSDAGTGQSATATISVTINDTEKPTISCPSDISLSVAPNVQSAQVNYDDITFNDNCPNPSLNQTNGLASGANFPVGTTTNTFVVTDAAGNTETCSFTVTIIEQGVLSITGLSDITVGNDAGNCNATINIPNPTIENGVGQLTIETSMGNPGANFTFPVGTTEITYNVSDAATGQSAMATIEVTVNDTELPTITCPGDISVDVAQGEVSAVVNFASPSFNDNCPDAILQQIEGLASGSAFPIGTTTNTFQVTDASGNTETCKFTVTINELGAFSLSGLSNISDNNDLGQCGANVTLPTPTIENALGQVVITTSLGENPGSEVFFPIGTTEVTYEARDNTDKVVRTTITITINDTQLPTITCPNDIFVEVAEGQSSVLVNYNNPAFSDNCPNPMLEQIQGLASGSVFPIGTTTNIFRVTDAAGNPRTCSFKVIVTEPIDDLPDNSIVDFELYNADTDELISKLEDNTVIILNETGDVNFNIQANTNPDPTGSVFLELTGPLNATRTESFAPYTLFGDDVKTGDYRGQKLPVGQYTIRATPYTQSRRRGDEGFAREITFTVLQQNPQPLPDYALVVRPANANGTTGGSGIFTEGTEVTATATPNNGFVFTNFTQPNGDVVSTNNPYTFTITENTNLIANFEAAATPKVTLTTSAGNGGSVNPNGSNTFDEGSQVTVTATPNSGFTFVNFTFANGNVASTNASYTFTINANVSLTANFEAIPVPQVTLNTSATAGGTISPNGSNKFDQGSQVTITATPNNGFTFVNFTFGNGNVASTNPSFTLTLNNNRSVIANFEEIPEPDGIAITSLVLFNADTDKALRELTEGLVFDKSPDGNPNYNIIAYTNSSEVGSVKFELRGPLNRDRVENNAIYALFGNNGDDLGGRRLFKGTYTITAIPYEQPNLQGKQGTPLKITFTVLKDGDAGSALVTNSLATANLSAFPNPSKGAVTLDWPIPENSTAELQVYDNAGTLVYRDTISGGQLPQANLSHLKSGVYTLRLVHNGEVQSMRLMLNQ